MRSSYVPIGLFVIVAIRFAVSPCLFSRLVHAEKPNPVKLEPYECGIETLGDARDRRYDQLMRLRWKVRIPLAIANLVVTATLKALL